MKTYTLTNPSFKKINDKLYQVIAEERIDRFINASGYRDYIGCDTIFKENKTEKYLFCREIEEATLVE
jgi:hypothetical protein